MKSSPAVTSTHMTKLQSIKRENHASSSLIWKAGEGEVYNLCPQITYINSMGEKGMDAQEGPSRPQAL